MFLKARVILSSAVPGAALAAVLAFGPVNPASAQGVDRYELNQIQKKLEAMDEELGRMRNALSGGDIQRRLNLLEDEISRLTGQVERLEFAVRKHDEDSKRKLEDLEYRIIELEGGDPSILFQEENNDQGALPPAVTPSGPSGSVASAIPSVDSSTPPATSGTLGVITTARSSTSDENVGGPELAAFDAGVSAVRAGRSTAGREVLQRFLSDYPNSLFVGDAHFWIGESYFQEGAYQDAASRYLDGATLYPNASKAPESLMKLGVSLGILGQDDVACSTLREVGQRYPQATTVVAQAQAEAQRSGCG